MLNLNLSRTFGLFFVLLAICFFGLQAQAEYGGGSGTTAPAERSTYVFLPDQSTVVQTGGIAGVHETYSIEGQFQLTFDFDAGIASFDQVDANLTDESGFLYTRSLGVLFNMTELLGTVVDDTTIDFAGQTADGTSTDILLTLTFTGDSVHFTGETIPPPDSADFFYYKLDAVARKKYGGGTGEPNDPYLINTAEQMNAIGAEPNDWDKHFKLMTDIDFSTYIETDFNIIGYYESYGSLNNKPFSGVFSGNNKKILGFNYSSTYRDGIGIFGYVKGKNAEIKDLVLTDPNFNAGTGDYVGLLVGCLEQGTLTNCYAQGSSVSGAFHVGGLVGANYSTIAGCCVSGSISGNYQVGGLVGLNSSSGRISKCCSSSGVSGESSVGGFVGLNAGYGTIVNCHATGSVTGKTKVGGLVGEIWQGTIINCYSAGKVTGTTDVGGLIGDKDESIEPECTDSFWDIQTSGQISSAGGAGKTTAEMQMESTFTDAGWDFVAESANGNEDIWSICEGTNYPRLTWQIPAGDFVCPDGIAIEDFVFFVEHWGQETCDLSNDYCQGTDLNHSGTVDTNDLEIFLENWLAVN